MLAERAGKQQWLDLLRDTTRDNDTTPSSVCQCDITGDRSVDRAEEAHGLPTVRFTLQGSSNQLRSGQFFTVAPCELLLNSIQTLQPGTRQDPFRRHTLEASLQLLEYPDLLVIVGREGDVPAFRNEGYGLVSIEYASAAKSLIRETSVNPSLRSWASEMDQCLFVRWTCCSITGPAAAIAAARGMLAGLM